MTPKLGESPDKEVFDIVKFEEEVMLEKELKIDQLKLAQQTQKHLKQPFEK